MSIEAIIGLALTGATSILIPIIKKLRVKHKKKVQKQNENNQILSSIPGALEKLSQENKEIKENLREVTGEQEVLKGELERYHIQTLKYMINDVFFGYNNIHEIPYETLLVAAEGCDIYISKGYNHVTRSRCDLIYEEIDRRQRNRAEGENNE